MTNALGWNPADSVAATLLNLLGVSFLLVAQAASRRKTLARGGYGPLSAYPNLHVSNGVRPQYCYRPLDLRYICRGISLVALLCILFNHICVLILI